jgi:hypothetical protein
MVIYIFKYIPYITNILGGNMPVVKACSISIDLENRLRKHDDENTYSRISPSAILQEGLDKELSARGY